MPTAVATRVGDQACRSYPAANPTVSAGGAGTLPCLAILDEEGGNVSRSLACLRPYSIPLWTIEHSTT